VLRQGGGSRRHSPQAGKGRAVRSPQRAQRGIAGAKRCTQAAHSRSGPQLRQTWHAPAPGQARTIAVKFSPPIEPIYSAGF